MEVCQARAVSEGNSRSAEWPGVADRTAFNPAVVDAGDRLADAARTGAWDSVFAVLGENLVGPNHWRTGGQSLYAPLHQAAWHGAPLNVVARLLDAGAWRSLREAAGKRPVDIAGERGHLHLLDVLATADPSEPELAKYRSWDQHLHALISERTRSLDPVPYRDVPTELVATEDICPLWFPYPGMYGGFAISVYQGRLFVESWSRVADGSGQAHVITERGRVLVDEGFV
jgi:hypothetical protein